MRNPREPAHMIDDLASMEASAVEDRVRFIADGIREAFKPDGMGAVLTEAGRREHNAANYEALDLLLERPGLADTLWALAVHVAEGAGTSPFAVHIAEELVDEIAMDMAWDRYQQEEQEALDV